MCVRVCVRDFMSGNKEGLPCHGRLQRLSAVGWQEKGCSVVKFGLDGGEDRGGSSHVCVPVWVGGCVCGGVYVCVYSTFSRSVQTGLLICLWLLFLSKV